MPAPAKLLIIGLDAADKDVIAALAARGKMPAFARLMSDALWGETHNPPGLEAGGVWPSFYTGVSPADHGMYYAFGRIAENGYDERPVEARDFTAEPFWETLSREGKRVCVIDAPYTFLREGLNGVQLVDWGSHAPMSGAHALHKAFQTWPHALADDVRARFGSDPIGYCDLLRLQTAAELARFRDQLVDRARRRTALSLDLLGQGGWDCFFTTFHECHCAGHQGWHLHDPAHPRFDPELTATVGDMVEDVYAAVDDGVAALIAAAGPDARVLVLCSHGMGANYTGSHVLDDVLLRLDGARPRETGKAFGRAVHKAWLAAPMPVKKLLAPLRVRLWPAVKKAVVEPDRAGRRAFEIRNNDATGGIRLNLKGRDPQGLLAPGDEAEAYVAGLIADLKDLINPATGRPAVRRVIRTTETYAGDRLHELPDLLVDWDRSAALTAVFSPKVGLIENRDLPTRSGDHRPDGVFFATGFGSAGRLNEPTAVEAFAPAIASLLGAAAERGPLAARLQPRAAA